MTTYHLLSLAPLVGLLVWAAVTDLHERKIRNWLTVSMALGGLIEGAIDGRPGSAVLGLVVGFVIPFLFFAIGALGGGDVKLLAGIGAWVGVAGVLRVMALEAVVGMVLVLFVAWREGKLSLLGRNSAVLAINLLHVRRVGVDHAISTGKSTRTVDRPLPFAVPVLAAVLILIAVGGM